MENKRLIYFEVWEVEIRDPNAIKSESEDTQLDDDNVIEAELNSVKHAENRTQALKSKLGKNGMV